MKRIITIAVMITATIALACAVWYLSAYYRQESANTDKKQDKHKILVIAPLTGSGAELGQSSRIGMEMALEDIAARNGDSSGIELVFQDSKTDPKTAISIFASRELYSEEKIVIGEMSGVTRALAEPARQANVLLLATLVGVPNLGGGSPYFARINVMSDAIAPPLARLAASRYHEMASLYFNDDYGKANFDLFKAAFENAGGKLVFSETFSMQPSDARLLVDKVKKSGVKAAFVAGYGPTYIALFRAFKEQAPNIQLFADIGLVNAPIFRAVGNAAEGVYVAATEIDEFPPSTERAKLFHQRYTNKNPSKRPDYVTAYSYDTIMILDEALRKVSDGDPNKIRDYLFEQTFDGFGGRFSYNPSTGDSVYEELPLFVIKDNEIKRLTRD